MPDTLARIVLVSPSFPPLPGGISDYADKLASALSCHRPVDVVTTEGLGTKWAGTEIARYTVRSVIKQWTWSGVPVILRTLSNLRPAMILFQDGKEQRSNPYVLMLLPLLLRLFTRCPVILVVHEIEGNRQQVQAHFSSGVIVVEQEYLKLFAKVNPRVELVRIGSNIPRCVPTSAEREEARQSLGVAKEEIAVGFFGFISPRKGFDILLEALSIVAANQSVCLVVLGEPVHDITLPKSFPIHWAGYLPPVKVAETLASMDVNALPFLDGARWRYGSLLAALNQDVPVVTTPGLGQTLSGMFECAPGNALDLAATILVAAQTRPHMPREISGWNTAADQIITFAAKVQAANGVARF